MTQRLLVLASLLVVFFGSATAAVAQARQIVSTADNAVLASPGAFIDFPAIDVRLVGKVSLLAKSTANGMNVFAKFSTVPGVFGDSVPAVFVGGCNVDSGTGLFCGTSVAPFEVAGPFLLIRAAYNGGGCSVCGPLTFSLDAYLVK